MSIKLSSLFRERSPPRSVQPKQKRKKRTKRDTDETGRTAGLLCLRESVNVEGVEWINSHLEEIVKEERTKWITYAKRVAGGERMVSYAPVAHGKGRVYADGALSLQSFSSKIRYTLAYGRYHDIDMINAHPTILKGICEKQGWPCPKLTYYIENREAVLLEVVERFNCTRGNAKVLMLRLMFGGAASTWKKDHSLDQDTPLPTIIEEYTLELDATASLIFDKYEDIPVVSTRKPKYSKMSLLIQDVENKILMEMSKFFRLNEYEPAVYMFDGLMIYRKTLGSVGPLGKDIMESCQTHLRDTMGWSVRLEEKAINKGFL